MKGLKLLSRFLSFKLELYKYGCRKKPRVLLRSYVIPAMFTFLQLISWIAFYELSHLKDATLATMFVLVL